MKLNRKTGHSRGGAPTDSSRGGIANITGLGHGCAAR